MSKILLPILIFLVLPLGLVAGALAGNRLPWLEPPGPWVRLKTYLGSNVARTDAAGAFTELRPRVYHTVPEEVFPKAREAMAELGWEVVREHRDGLRLDAVVTTRLLRFKDDFVVRLAPGEGQTAVHAESRSRVGRGDLGANTRHILDFYERLDPVP
ncbi:MAG: DUF1499 domain-containing protein [Gammaproteobacteria bacterium]